jgi:hypothetical protein
MHDVLDLENCSGWGGDSSQPCKKVCSMVTLVCLMLMLIEMFSTSVGVVQNSFKGPSLAGGISVVGGWCRYHSCGRLT